VQNGRITGYLYDPIGNNFVPDDNSAPLSDGALRALAAVSGQEVTYTATTPGSGARIALAMRRLTENGTRRKKVVAQ
jgi:hypothetical protein